ncbi:hypothetical protein [Actinophytocola xanthii]|uniref:Uncharacterized protein n=1 Tax=Actinophytocola xanthii TaxID=1912961 RepID=A0A1Q8C2J3_9PSEU|nr:hypothetical protein [Actinophytocola xanthii]OLF08561.1 hypothetical protein BU204_34275 [Actinophytocola xanthii]
MTSNANHDQPADVGGARRRFQPGDVLVGDWVWGVGAWLVHPVIRVNRHSVTVGIHRVSGGWLTTERLRWEDIRGVIPAESDLPSDLAQTLADAARRVHRGFLDADQRAALAALLQVAGSSTLPTPVTAVLHAAVTALTRAPRDRPASARDQPSQKPNDSHHTRPAMSRDDSEEDRP